MGRGGNNLATLVSGQGKDFLEQSNKSLKIAAVERFSTGKAALRNQAAHEQLTQLSKVYNNGQQAQSKQYKVGSENRSPLNQKSA